MQVLELFSGIGGCATALEGVARVECAVDQDQSARDTYALRFDHPQLTRNLHHVKPSWFERFGAVAWWMSPPCQPYTVRGKGLDLQDRRSLAFQRIVEAVAVHRPRVVAMENVPGFQRSQGETLILGTLAEAGYQVHHGLLCPSSLGIPAQRRRYYLVASTDGLVDPGDMGVQPLPLAAFLDPFDQTLAVEAELRQRYVHALHTVEAEAEDAVTACFTGAYARSPVHAGSYLSQGSRLRRFSPVEIARTLGLGEVRFPPGLSMEKQYKLVGNSLSVWAVRAVLAWVPSWRQGLREAQQAARAQLTG